MQMIRMAPAPARRSKSSQHRIDHHDVAPREIGRELRVVLRRDRRQLVALQADMAHARMGDELQHGVEHAEAGAQDRDDDHVRSDPQPAGRSDRRFDGRGGGREVAQRLSRQQDADPRGRATKLFGRSVFVPQRHERVVHQRVVDQMDRHGLTLYLKAFGLRLVARVHRARADGPP
jgi:hypothetical protein